jgi:hypothetical protein
MRGRPGATLSGMSIGNSQARPVAFDPYGEPLEAEREAFVSAGNRRARTVTAVVFWMVALALVVGRIYLGPAPVSQTLAAAKAHLVASVATR